MPSQFITEKNLRQSRGLLARLYLPLGTGGFMTSKDDDADQIDKEAAMETAKRIMKRLAETPHSPHKPLGEKPSKNVPVTPKPKELSRGPFVSAKK
jgi:hypothetical protein